MAYRNSNTGAIIAGIIGFIIVACVIFVVAVAIKAGVDGTSFVDSWNTIWGIEAVAPVDPEVPVDPDASEEVEETVETVASFLK